MSKEERDHLELNTRKVMYGGDTTNNGNIGGSHEKRPNGIPAGNPFDLDPLKIPYSQQRQSSQWTFSLTNLIRKRNQFQRLISKDGRCNILHTHLKYRRFRMISDAYTTLIDLKWRYILLIFCLSYGLSWFIFAIAWYMTAWVHGDLSEPLFGFLGFGETGSETDYDYVGSIPGSDGSGNVSLAVSSVQLPGDSGSDTQSDYNDICNFDWYDEPCVYNMETFFAAFLFSVETQTSIGYGFRSITEACVYAAVLASIQSIFSYLLNTILLGLIFAKIGSPSNRTATLKFSRNAVIAMRNGKLCFMFRIGNIRSSQLYESHMRVYAMKPTLTTEGEFIPLFHHNMDLSFSTGEDRTLTIWPVIICHIIDEKSPLFEISAEDLQDANLEIIIFLEGVVQQTGLVTQARTSYIPSEIKWGYRYSSSVIRLDSEKDKQYKIDYKKFNSIYEVPDTPFVSAKQIYKDMKKKDKEHSRQKRKGKSSHLEKIPENPDEKKPPPNDDPEIIWNTTDYPEQPKVTVEEPSSPPPTHNVTIEEPPSPPPIMSNKPRPVDGLIIQSLQELTDKIQNLENALDKRASDGDIQSPSMLNTSSIQKNPKKRRSWSPKKMIGLEMKRKSYQGSTPTNLSPSADESFLVPPDEDDLQRDDTHNCIVS